MFEDNQFESFFDEIEDFCNYLETVSAQSATVRDSLRRICVPRRVVKPRERRRVFSRIPDRQWHNPIRANAPPWMS
jgi:hypothetical protein